MPLDLSSLSAVNLYNVRNKWTVITGGGSGELLLSRLTYGGPGDICHAYVDALCQGIGRTLASGYAVNGANVIITGRRDDVLNETARELNEAISGGGGKVYP